MNILGGSAHNQSRMLGGEVEDESGRQKLRRNVRWKGKERKEQNSQSIAPGEVVYTK